MASEERLTLRGPAKAAWARAGPVLAEHLAAPGLDPTKGWTLAGGTVLAARWSWHRASTDLDILVEPESRVTLWEMADVEGRLVKLDCALAVPAPLGAANELSSTSRLSGAFGAQGDESLAVREDRGADVQKGSGWENFATLHQYRVRSNEP